MTSDPRRTYYDHEPAYASRRAQGFRGWSIAERCLSRRRYDIDPETGVNGNRTRIWVSKARMLDEIAHAGLQVKNCERHPPDNQDESGDELVLEAIKPPGCL